MVTGNEGTRLLEYKTINEKLKLQRTVCSVNGNSNIQRTYKGSSSASFIRQCYNSSHDQWHGRFIGAVRYDSQDNSYRGYGGQYNVKREIFGRNLKLEGGASFTRKGYVRVASTPQPIQTVRQGLGTPSYRQVRFNHIDTVTSVQFPVLGSAYVRNRRVISDRLGPHEQLCKSAVKSTEYSQGAKGCSHFNRAQVDRSTVLSLNSSFA